MKISLVGTEYFHADVGTDRHDEANSRITQILRMHVTTDSS
jgi:hypothetical protein